MKNSVIPALLTAGAFAITGASAHAKLVQADPFKIDMTGTGLGNVQTILTISSPGSTTTETGSVFAMGAGQQTSGDTVAINQLQNFSGPASNLRIVFNPSEPQNDSDGITLQALVLTAFDAAGGTQFTSGAFSPVTLTATDAGTGNSGFVFKLDPTQAAQMDAAIGGGPTRIGLTATALDATGGHETFFLTAVPEPGTWAMLAAGAIGIAGMMRRRVSS
jgi:hypothetical protein